MLFTKLLNIQRRLFQAVKDPKESTEALSVVEPLPDFPPYEQIRVHQRNIQTTLLNTLEKIYPVTEKIVGREFFQWMVKEYNQTLKQPDPSLILYGKELPQFIDYFEAVKSLPFLGDVARLEWAWHHAHFTIEENTFDFDALSQVPIEKQSSLVFHLPKSATIIETKYPALTIWDIHQPDFEGEGKVDMEQGGETLLIWRDGHQVRIERLSGKDSIVLKLFQQTLPFSEICEEIESIEGMPTPAALLPHYLQRRWLSAFSLAS